MFERYTKEARQAIFFAFYEASSVGSPIIETEHLLLGLVRENGAMLDAYFQPISSDQQLHSEIALRSRFEASTLPSVDLPLSKECERILVFGEEEATTLGYAHIAAEHLMLGILREKECLAAKLLDEHGLHLEQARTALGSQR